MKLKALPAMLAMIPAVIRGVRPADLSRLGAIVRATFPEVRQITTGELAEGLAAGPARWLLLDVRTPAEFAVSHLPGALNLQTTGEIARAMAEHQPDETILYCAVGFRAARLARQLQRQGARTVATLAGSIFQWANEGRPVFQGQRPARRVHPGGERWAGLLNPGLASLTP